MPSNEVADNVSPKPNADRPWTFRDYLWRGGLIFFTLSVVFATVVTFWFFVQYGHYSRQLKQTVAKIRAAGGPLDEAEIEAYYHVPDGVEDLTDEYLAALAFFLQRERTPPTQSPEEELLPYVGGKGTNTFGTLVSKDADLRPTAEKYLTPFQPSLAQLRELGTKQGRCRYPVKMADNIMALIPHAQAVRDAARHLALDFEVQMLAGNRELALADSLALLKLGESLSNEPISISQLVRFAVFGMFERTAEELLADGKASETELAALDAALADVDFQAGLKRALNGERAMGYLALQSNNARQVAAFAGSQQDPGYIPPVGNLRDLRPGDTATLLQMETDMLEAASAEFPQALANMQRVEDELKQMAAETKLPWNKNVLTTMLMPTMSAMGNATARSLAVQRALQAAIAMERHFAKTGERPTSLAELVPDYLPAVPIDPFSGVAMNLKVTDDGYAIYSTGKDRIDNGGMLDEQQADVGVKIRTQAAK